MQSIFVIFVVIIGVMALMQVIIFVHFLGPWMRAFTAGHAVPIFSLIGMKLRRVPIALIVDTHIRAQNSNLQVSLEQLEKHYLAGGKPDRVIDALMLIGSILGLGGYVGHKMYRDSERSPRHRAWVAGFWRAFVIGAAVFIVPALFMGGHPQLQHVRAWWAGLFYVPVAGTFLVWRWRRRARRSQEAEERCGWQARRKVLTVWVALAVAIGLALIALAVSDSIWDSQVLSQAEMRKLVVERGDAQFKIMQYQNGVRNLQIKLPEHGKHFCLIAPVNETTRAVLAENGITCSTYVQGRDFEVLRAPGRWLCAPALFVVAAGAAFLLLRRRVPKSDSRAGSCGVGRFFATLRGYEVLPGQRR